MLSWTTSVNLERDCTGKLPTLLGEVSDHLLECLQSLAFLTFGEVELVVPILSIHHGLRVRRVRSKVAEAPRRRCQRLMSLCNDP